MDITKKQFTLANSGNKAPVYVSYNDIFVQYAFGFYFAGTIAANTLYKLGTVPDDIPVENLMTIPMRCGNSLDTTSPIAVIIIYKRDIFITVNMQVDGKFYANGSAMFLRGVSPL